MQSREERTLPKVSVQDLDQLLKAEGQDILISGADRQESLPDDPSQFNCYMPEMEVPVPGTPKTQMRIRTSVKVPRPGLALIDITEFALLVEDTSTGKFEYDQQYSSNGAVRTETSNTVSYRAQGDGVNVVAQLRSSVKVPLIQWLPISETVFGSMVEGIVSLALKSSQQAMLDRLEKRCREMR